MVTVLGLGLGLTLNLTMVTILAKYLGRQLRLDYNTALKIFHMVKK